MISLSGVNDKTSTQASERWKEPRKLGVYMGLCFCVAGIVTISLAYNYSSSHLRIKHDIVNITASCIFKGRLGLHKKLQRKLKTPLLTPKNKAHNIKKYPYLESITALLTIAEKWFSGKFRGYSSKFKFGMDEREADICLAYLRGLRAGANQSKLDTKLTGEIYRTFIKLRIHLHIAKTASHRKYMKVVYSLLKNARVDLAEELSYLINIHDLSKYGPEEISAGTHPFASDISSKMLRYQLWISSKRHHYKTNPHHPQYFGNKLMPEKYIDESIIDMVATRMERDFGHIKIVTPLLLFSIPDQYLKRYKGNDRRLVKRKLSQWTRQLDHFILTNKKKDRKAISQWERTTGKTLKSLSRAKASAKGSAPERASHNALHGK